MVSPGHAPLATTDAASQRAREYLDVFPLLGMDVLAAQKPAGGDEEVEAQKLTACVLNCLSENRALAVDGTL
jgi:hypothetical protein